MKPLDKFEADIRMFDQGLAEFLEAYKNIENEYQKLLNDYSNHVEEMKKLLIEVKELREYKNNATRKHWQNRAAINACKYIFEKDKLMKIIEIINKNQIDNNFWILEEKDIYEINEIIKEELKTDDCD